MTSQTINVESTREFFSFTSKNILLFDLRTVMAFLRQNETFLQWSLIMQLTASLQQLFTFCCYDVVYQILNDGYCPSHVL